MTSTFRWWFNVSRGSLLLCNKITCTWHTMWVDVATCHCNNRLPIKMASRGRPIIDLFTDLSQQHVTCACHMRGPGACATSCCCDMSHEFKLIGLHVTCCCDKSWCHEACSCGEVSWRQLASCDRTFSCVYIQISTGSPTVTTVPFHQVYM